MRGGYEGKRRPLFRVKAERERESGVGDRQSGLCVCSVDACICIYSLRSYL